MAFPTRFSSSFCHWHLSSYRAEDLDHKPCEMVSFSSWHSNTLVGETFGRFLCAIAAWALDKHVGKHEILGE